MAWERDAREAPAPFSWDWDADEAPIPLTWEGEVDEAPVPLNRGPVQLQDEEAPTDDQLLEEPSTGAVYTEPPGRASEFTDDYMLRPTRLRPKRGWRRVVHMTTGINPGLSKTELLERELMARIKAPVVGCRRIAVISRKGGVGKTTTCLLLGHTFSIHRGDRVIALDANPDAGSLGYRVPRETRATVTDLLGEIDNIDRYPSIRSYTNQAATRLEVIASDDDPRITQALGRDDYQRVTDLLERYYNLILADTGTGILDSASRGMLDIADQIVLVMGASLDGARAASLTLDWLDEHGYDDLVLGAVAVINAVRSDDGLVELYRVEEHFDARCRGVVRIPWDPHLNAGAETDLDELSRGTGRAYLELAACVAEGFVDGR